LRWIAALREDLTAPPMGTSDLTAAFDRLGSARMVSPSAGRSIPSGEASPVGLGHC